MEKSVNLDTNHTHYILVDNGTFRTFGGEIEFRGLFEKFISQMMTDGDESSSTNVPVVSIVVEGGPGTLTTVKAAIDNATPVVILEVSVSFFLVQIISSNSCQTMVGCQVAGYTYTCTSELRLCIICSAVVARAPGALPTC